VKFPQVIGTISCSRSFNIIY